VIRGTGTRQQPVTGAGVIAPQLPAQLADLLVGALGYRAGVHDDQVAFAPLGLLEPLAERAVTMAAPSWLVRHPKGE
jgi:hypothetical protein